MKYLKGFCDMKGRQIEYIVAPGDGSWESRMIRSDKNEELVAHSEYHGEYDVPWVICRNKTTKVEIARYNARYLEEVKWI